MIFPPPATDADDPPPTPVTHDQSPPPAIFSFLSSLSLPLSLSSPLSRDKEGARGVDGGVPGGRGEAGGGGPGVGGWGPGVGGGGREEKGEEREGVASDRPAGAGAGGGGPEVSHRRKEEKREKGEEKREKITAGGGSRPGAGCGSLVSGVGRRRPSPATEKTLGGKYYVSPNAPLNRCCAPSRWSLSHPCFVHCSPPSCSSPPTPICSPTLRATHRRITSSSASRANHCPIATRNLALGIEESEILTAKGGRGASKVAVAREAQRLVVNLNERKNKWRDIESGKPREMEGKEEKR
ncbi:hypothetical protein TIFTF001_023425 [Ficus carica]|uniref:Uncharacterized protein n=1 Tax=Ficus carica TaxID=3494 RepID=A0AA88AKW4_FICCA|nr:hypothetical protein TIFTF001_023425 [Ficus carica]